MKGKKMQGNRSKIASSNPMLKAKDQPNLNTKKKQTNKRNENKKERWNNVVYFFKR
jgi:hypothetical protein